MTSPGTINAGDADAVARLIRAEGIEEVVHFAGLTLVGDTDDPTSPPLAQQRHRDGPDIVRDAAGSQQGPCLTGPGGLAMPQGRSPTVPVAFK